MEISEKEFFIPFEIHTEKANVQMQLSLIPKTINNFKILFVKNSQTLY